MRDDAEDRRKLIEQLEAVMRLAEEIGQPITGFLIARALDEARAAIVAGR